MSRLKDWMAEQDAQGWSSTDQHVCTRCVDDYALEAAIEAHQEPEELCDFCGLAPAAPLDDLLDVFVRGLRNEYGDPDDECVFWDGRDGGYQAETTDSWDLVEQYGDVLVGDGLLEAVRDAIHHVTWVDKDFATLHRDEILSASWDRFCEAVQYETRYVFWLRNDEDEELASRGGEVPASRILDEVGKLIELTGMVVVLPAGSRFWRAQSHETPTIHATAKRLGTAPREDALYANRMSPAGIPMFYGAKDSSTAMREVRVRAPNTRATLGLFETSRDCMVVDFTNLPKIPSVFDPERGQMRRSVSFLHDFANKLKEAARERYEQIDYVPTQIITEYLFRIYARSGSVEGLVYQSSMSDGTCVVLNVPNERCVDQTEGWQVGAELHLGLVEGSIEVREMTSEPETS